MNLITHHQSLSQELGEIQSACSEILKNTLSQANLITLVYKDKAGKTLSLRIPNDQEILDKLPPGGTYFTGIN